MCRTNATSSVEGVAAVPVHLQEDIDIRGQGAAAAGGLAGHGRALARVVGDEYGEPLGGQPLQQSFCFSLAFQRVLIGSGFGPVNLALCVRNKPCEQRSQKFRFTFRDVQRQ